LVPNEEIEERLGVAPGWIEGRTGIKQRRFAAPEDSAASLGARAGRNALEKGGINPASIDQVIVATCTPDYVFPPCASLVQNELGIPTTSGAFDLNAACSGFIYAMSVASAMIGSSMAGRVLLIGVDLLSRHLNLDDPVTAPLFGDGAGAVVLDADPAARPIRFELGADGAGAESVIVPGSGSRLPAALPESDVMQHLSCIRMAGRDVYRKAVKTMSAQGASLGRDGFDLLVAHQANRRILDECAAQLGIDKGKVFVNIEQYGNTSAGSIPIALCEAWETGRLRPADRLLLLGFGAGYTWGGAIMDWTLAPPSGAHSEDSGAILDRLESQSRPASVSTS